MGLSRIILFSLILLNSTWLCAQKEFTVKEIGTPFIRNYSPAEYGGQYQIWSIDKDSLGRMYFSVSGQLIRFDGANWETISNPDGYPMRSVFTAPNNEVYFGERNGFGHLEIDSTNSYVPRVLHSLLDAPIDKFGRVTFILNFENQVMFLSQSNLYAYSADKNSVSLIKNSGGFRSMSLIQNRLILAGSKRGLYEFKEGRLIPLPNNDELTNLKIGFVAPYSKGKLLLMSPQKGLFIYDYLNVNELNTPLRNDLIASNIYSALDIDGKYTSIGTTINGTFIIDRKGNLIQKLDKKNGLPSNTNFSQYLDDDGSLWIGTENGVSHVYLSSPMTMIGFDKGFEGSTWKIHEQNGYIYIAGQNGIFYKSPSTSWQSSNNNEYLVRLKDVDFSSWFFVTIGNDLFCATTGGLIQINKGESKFLSRKKVAFAYVLNDSSLIAIGLDEKHYFFHKKDGKWSFKNTLLGFEQYADFTYKTKEGKIWLSDSDRGLFSYSISSDYDSIISLRNYKQKHGLPAEKGIRVFPYAGAPVFATGKGVYRYDSQNDSFNKDPMFESLIGDNSVYRFREMSNGDLYHVGGSLGRAHLKKTGVKDFKIISAPFANTTAYNNEYVYSQSDSNLFIATRAGVLHYDPTKEFRSNSYQSIIASAHTTTDGDSLIFGGAGVKQNLYLAYHDNGLRFKFGSTSYDEHEKTAYAFYLKGFEETWSDWTTGAEKEYTNLTHGEYSFQVKSKNIYDEIGTTATFGFTILPPWYFTIYAYIGYFALFVLFVWSIVRLNSSRLIKEKKALEQVVTERTEEIRGQKNSIEKQAKKLQEMDHVKSRFFANISHELRTPITLINGPVEAMLKGEYGTVDKALLEGLNVVKNNGRSLSTLVNEILDLTKLEAGKLKLTENPVQLYSFMMELLAVYQEETKSRQIDLEVDFQYGKEVSLLLDELKFSKIINNLLSNAFKFIPDNGSIVLAVKEVNENLSIGIQDNGQGIHSDDITHVFERFYQSEQPESKAQGGTGIGLALSQELAKLHHGSISVASELGKGSEFTFTFPPKVIASNLTNIIDEEINVGIIKTNLEATVSKYIDIFEIDKPVLLLTEDHKEMREFIGQIVQPYFLVLEASNGIEALGILKSNRVDMIISDVMMPKMDGFELLEKIKSDESLKKISMIMLTARAAEEDKLFALTLGVDDYLTKPFSSEELLVRAKNILDNRIVRKLSESETSQASEDLPNVEVKFINDLRALIEKNISDSLLSVTYLASQVAMSERQLLRKLKNLTGFSPIQFIKEVKLQRAKKLLESNQVATVAEASYSVGIDKVDYFSSQYVSRFGKRPSESLSA